MKKTLIFLFSLSIMAGSNAFGQLTTIGGMTPTQYVQNVLLGGGIVASNVTFTGDPQAISSFTFAPGSSLGFGAGLLMSTGKAVTGTDGPQGPQASNFASTDFNEPGDNDLAAIANESPSNLNDAVVLEFDFVPQSDSVKFNYIFSSEEYNTFVFGYNDIFAFILSGVTTPLPPTNIALVPGTSLPVAIGNINNGSANPSTGPCVNCQFYRDNTNGAINIAYRGITTVLTARYQVICGETYHIKLVIADMVDGIYDSGVFLEAGSFSSSAPFVIGTTGNSVGPIGSNNTLYENCGTLNLAFTRPTTLSANADTLVIDIDGTASPADYTGLTDTIFFPPGVDTVMVPVYAPNDGISDAGETVHIFYTYLNTCNNVDTIDYTFTLQEPPTFTHTLSDDTTICSAQAALLTSAVSGGVAPFLYNWTNQGGTTVSSGPNFSAPPAVQTYYYYATDACRQDTLFDSVHVDVNTFLYLTGTLDVIGSSIDTLMVEGCGSATLTFTENGAGAGVGTHSYPITITGTLDNGTGADMGVIIPDTITLINQTSVVYNLNALTDALAENGSGTGLEHITITIDYGGNPCIPVSGLVIKTLYIKDPGTLTVSLPNDTSICKGRGLLLKATTTGGGGIISYSWPHNVNITTSTTTVMPTVTTTYYVTATESCNGQTATDSIKVTVLYDPPIVNSLAYDSICIGSNYEFSTIVTNGIGAVTGSWLHGVPDDLQQNGSANDWIIYNVHESGTYIYSVKDACNFKDYDTLTLQALDCDLVVPNIVTVNGDRINDVFYIKNLHKHPETAVSIMDRWGKKVYTTNNYDNKWSPVDEHDGVYFYIVQPKKGDALTGYLHIFTKK